MEVSEVEAIAALADRDIRIADAQASVDRLKKLRPGTFMLFEPPVVMDVLPGIFQSIGRHTELGAGVDFGLVQSVGSFVTIADEVMVGKAEHPTGFVSVSNIFYAEKAPTGFGRKDARFLARNHDQIVEAGRRHMPRNRRPTMIGDDVFIGARATIARGVRIGTGAIVGAGAVVVKDVAPYTVVAGIPARPIRPRFEAAVADALAATRWWRRDFALMQDLDWTDAAAAAAEMTRRLAESPQRYQRDEKIIVLRRQEDGTLNLFKRRTQPG